MRQLMWMARAKRRDEWGRFAALLNLVHNRTITDEAKQRPTEEKDWYPPGMITAAEIREAQEAAIEAERERKERNTVRVPFKVAMERAFGKS